MTGGLRPRLQKGQPPPRVSHQIIAMMITVIINRTQGQGLSLKMVRSTSPQNLLISRNGSGGLGDSKVSSHHLSCWA